MTGSFFQVRDNSKEELNRVLKLIQATLQGTSSSSNISSLPVQITSPSIGGGGSSSGGITPTGVTAGAYGDDLHVATFTVNIFGQLTEAATSAVTLASETWVSDHGWSSFYYIRPGLDLYIAVGQTLIGGYGGITVDGSIVVDGQLISPFPGA